MYLWAVSKNSYELPPRAEIEAAAKQFYQLLKTPGFQLELRSCTNPDNPLFNEQGNSQNGFLRLHDVFNLNLPAELVVLSACQTGLGQEVKGEGLVGLTRGFMYAGSQRVLVSLWNVSDTATAEMMKRFYRNMLQEGLSATAALRAAQLEMQQETQWKAPYYWAAFTLQGEWRMGIPGSGKLV
ncbi:MAG: CHAT domain-containing protein [Symploca sp. SIO2E6]|nr:CHAT domain-containing protein [Symploca sp. SIO2E6]